ncbi:unnamed protein product [Caenorhabditis angaria]|uniref:Transthyretin-like family protein n=1 Tax=Caenorhabditis angaria TaxID=860376 RepID=A0A9P1N6X6_9PELO|nr:unnamed protein product [Caenorhabditis angaria]
MNPGFLLIFVQFLAESSAFRLQGAAVRGALRCHGKPWRNAKLKLYDLDRNPGDEDDLLDEKYSDKEGWFQVDGTTRELSDIEPVLYVYHDCDDGIRPCQKKLTFVIPKSYIHHGKATRVYDVGILNLEKNETIPERSCNH